MPGHRTVRTTESGIPVPLSSFVGRVAELEQVRHLLSGHRLVTIAGPGGAGKTRLAGEVIGDPDPGSVLWVSLADSADVTRSISTALGASTNSDVTALADALTGPEMLLVLDNCEHMVADAAEFVDRALRRSPALRVLVTSRVPLDVEGEVIWRIPPLSLPEPGDGERAARFDAVGLFLERASHTGTKFTTDEDTLAAVVDICWQVGALPLGIELAAARTRSLSLDQIRQDLGRSLRVLAVRRAPGHGRLGSLEASIDWSHRLLDATEQAVFRRLAVFAGGVSIDDVEAVVADDEVPPDRVVSVVDSLVLHSLVQFDATPRPRFRMLEPIRQFASARLAAMHETDLLGARHADRYLALARAAAPWLETAFDADRFAALVEDDANFDDAFRTLVASGRFDEAVELVWNLRIMWALTRPSVVEEHAATLEGTIPDQALARLLVARADARNFAGDAAVAAADAAAAFTLLEAYDPYGLAGRALLHVGLARTLSQPGSGDETLKNAIRLCVDADDAYGELMARCYRAAGLLLVSFEQAEGELELAAAATIAGRLRNPIWEARCWALAGCSDAHRGRLDGSDRAAVLAGDALAELGDRCREPIGHRFRASSLGSLGEFGTAYAACVRPSDPGTRADRVTRAAQARAEGFIQASLLWDLAAGIDHLCDGETDHAADALERSSIDARRIGAPFLDAYVAPFLADVALARNDAHRALEILDTVERTAIDGSHLASARFGIRAAVAYIDLGDLPSAEREARAAGAALVGTELPWEGTQVLHVLAELALARDAPIEAARLLGTGRAVSSSYGFRRDIDMLGQRCQSSDRRARAVLGSEAHDREIAAGAALSVDDALALASRMRGRRGRPSFGWDSLTPTEREVVALVAEGLSNPEIGTRLLMGRQTVKTHLARIFPKLGVTSRAELAAAHATRLAQS